MKKRIILIGIIAIICLFFACPSKKMKGVVTSETGELQTVTFELPEGKKIQEVLGCGVGSENTMRVTSMGSNGTKDFCVYWYKVNNGGIISKRGNIYRYGPNADVEYQKLTNEFRPPNWVMIYDTPSSDNLFNPEDAEELQEKYGLKLNF